LRVSFQFWREVLPTTPVIFAGRGRPFGRIRRAGFPRRIVGAPVIGQTVQIDPINVVAAHRSALLGTDIRVAYPCVPGTPPYRNRRAGHRSEKSSHPIVPVAASCAHSVRCPVLARSARKCPDRTRSTNNKPHSRHGRHARTPHPNGRVGSDRGRNSLSTPDKRPRWRSIRPQSDPAVPKASRSDPCPESSTQNHQPIEPRALPAPQLSRCASRGPDRRSETKTRVNRPIRPAADHRSSIDQRKKKKPGRRGENKTDRVYEMGA
jgi:hypothetical protein